MMIKKKEIAIIETGHFQYALTQSEIFDDCSINILTTEKMRNDMLEYSPEISNFNFIIIKNINQDEKKIINFIENKDIDILLISPVFDSYFSLKRIVKKIKCIKVITIHNINTWFYGRFWSPNSYMDRVNMRSVIKNCDYVSVEDFIYNHLKSTNDKLFKKYKFLYIPFTIFHEHKSIKYIKTDNRLKVVLTGAIDGDRRRYEKAIKLIKHFIEKRNRITFSFAGRAKGDYGLMIQNQLREIQNKYPKLVSFFENNSTVDMFRKEMETSDIVLSTSTKTFNGMGTIEYIGKTKPTAAIHDMISYELPGLLPSHLKVSDNLEGSVFNYETSKDLIDIFENLISNPTIILEWKEKAKNNSLNYTAKVIRKGLPF